MVHGTPINCTVGLETDGPWVGEFRPVTSRPGAWRLPRVAQGAPLPDASMQSGMLRATREPAVLFPSACHAGAGAGTRTGRVTPDVLGRRSRGRRYRAPQEGFLSHLRVSIDPRPLCSLTQRSCRRRSQGAEGAQLPGHCGLVTDRRVCGRDHRDKAPGSAEARRRHGRVRSAMKVARTAAGAVVDARMNGVEAACDPDEICLHCVIVERRQLDTPEAAFVAVRSAVLLEEVRSPNPAKRPSMAVRRGHLPCEHARREAGDACGDMVGGQAPAGEPRRCRCEPHGPHLLHTVAFPGPTRSARRPV